MSSRTEINPFARHRLADPEKSRSSERYLSIRDQFDNDCEAVAVLDPLEVDGLMQVLPQMTAGGYVPALVSTLKRILPMPDKLLHFDFFESAACMRDIGIFLGALKRHGVEPLTQIPELDFVLYTLAEKTNLPPRDTLLHYTVWNPTDERIRTYTGSEDEKALIKSVQLSMGPLSNAIYTLSQLYNTALVAPRFALLAEMIYLDFKSVVKGIVYAKKKVSPKVFAIELRHYFDSIQLDGKEWIGPGAVEMPFFVFDHILWSSDCDDTEYVGFKQTYLPFITPDLRKIYHQFEGRPSLITSVCKELNEDTEMDELKIDAAKRVIDLCNLLKSFRMPHRKLAEDAYKYEEDRHSDKGSGGYSTSILTHIIDLNLAKVKELEHLIKQHQLAKSPA